MPRFFKPDQDTKCAKYMLNSEKTDISHVVVLNLHVLLHHSLLKEVTMFGYVFFFVCELSRRTNMKKTKKNSAPRGIFRLVENSLKVIVLKTKPRIDTLHQLYIQARFDVEENS